MPERDKLEFAWIFTVLRHWWWLIAACTAATIVVAWIFTSMQPLLYEASTTLFVQPSRSNSTNEYNTLVAGERLALTYTKMLTSRPVLEEVISQLNLHLSTGALAERITVEPVQETQLIRLTVSGPSPTETAQIANALADAFTAQIETLETQRYTGSLTNMQNQIQALAAQTDEGQAQIDSLRARKIQSESELMRQESLLAGYHEAYSQAQLDHKDLLATISQLESRIQIIESADQQQQVSGSGYRATATLLVNQVSGTDRSGLSAGTYGQMLAGRAVLEETITKLELPESADALAERVSVQTEPETQLIQLTVVDGDPARAALIANTLAEVFVARMRTLLTEPYATALATASEQIDTLPTTIAETQSQIEKLNASIAQAEADLTRLETLQAEARDDARQLQQDYDQLSLTTKDVANTVVSAEPAQVPRSPVSHRTLYTAVAMLIGMVGGTGLAFFFTHLDDRMRTEEDVRAATGLTTLGTVGRIPRSGESLVVISQPRSPVTESFRVLATSIRFADSSKPVRTLLVTSPQPEEGKSTITANLAAIMAQAGLRVVVVDADLRRPSLRSFFDLDERAGLSTSIAEGNLDGLLQETKIAGLRALASGDPSANPAALLSSPHLIELVQQIADQADMVLVDSAPVLPAADTALLARAVDGVLLVLDAGHSRRSEVKEATKRLQQVGATVLGVIFNGSPTHEVYYQEYSPKPTEPQPFWIRVATAADEWRRSLRAYLKHQ